MRSKTIKKKFKRRNQSKTNYAKRLCLLKSKLPRLVVRKSNNNINAQIIEWKKEGDKTLVCVNSKSLNKFDWKGHKGNVPSAYLTGYLLGIKSKKKGIENLVLDIGLQTPILGSRIFAVLKGVLEANIKVTHNKKALPSDERIKGSHIQDYASKLNEERFKKLFSNYFKQGFNPKNFIQEFEKTKKMIDEKGALNG